MPYCEEGDPPGEPDPHPLDSVIWRAVTSVQESLAEGDERARRYPADIAPFAAMVDTEPASFRSLLALVGGDDQIALFTTEEVEPPSALSVVRRDSVDQMVLEDAGACAAQPGVPIVALGVADVPEMIALANVTQPGPFGPRTIELGHYIGIRRQGALVAMAGERMRLDGFTEISAVCVEPAHRGHGFAAELVRSLASSIAARSEIPFLHVFSSNHAAIALYRKLGFTLRRRMHLAVLIRAVAG
ncbi:MAG TPA: GNAT family N-acetyltransferase [Steroidobacteraceae bacterium]|nr:GNAT family N-acetyltransferase [Steroidobacteraceae bacterium]